METTRLQRWLKKLEVSAKPGLSNTQLMLMNHDLQPVEHERRQWGWYNFVAFWIADSLNINTWMISSSMIVDGLSWWQSWICVWVGYFIAACFVCLTGRIGAVYHISFPVACRSSFGIWGSFWPVFNRAAMAVVWYGVQGYIGGECVTLMIRSIWPSYNNLPNGIPASAGVDTKNFLSFFLFWLLSLPALWFPVHKIRHLFTVKAIYSPIAAIAFFAWAISRANGIGPIVHQPASVHGSVLAWAVVKSIMSCLSNFATLIVNDPDFSRFSRTPKDALWSQLLTIPIGFGITSFIGIIVSSSSAVIFGGDFVWNPLDLLGKFLDGASSAERFGVFIISTGFALAQLGTNISANSVSAGTDMTALLPRYINIRRGSYVCAAIGLAMCPWKLQSSSNQFTTYLSAYSVFLSSIAGPIVCDYYIVRKGYLQVKDLYNASRSSPYHYICGFSWHAYASYIAGILVNIVGFAGAVGRDVPVGAQYIYNINYFSGFVVSAVMYYALTRFFPIPGTSETWHEVKVEGALSIADGEEVDGEEENTAGKPIDFASTVDQKHPKSRASSLV
ncbi:nucleobase cation symporter-1 family protein [Aspergillus brunneoviolaceus CBS 621.78]|uniref:Uridine permease Fui1 n=1 Tax=Aspergillus brunneoviolaceus CBS 621.78 TaxID=1450534 RepID=A0ACD1FVH2_9EURO|nr:uridine permease Fui1 [Aspergillus brunneoviolaceus CBS 621.78]RAH40972.1 uridine permease Fui1 [Aspergillus brunneoviolaceus CBS 621.78]